MSRSAEGYRARAPRPRPLTCPRLDNPVPWRAVASVDDQEQAGRRSATTEAHLRTRALPPRRRLRRFAIVALLAISGVLVATTTALALYGQSWYRTGGFVAGTVYNSIERPWNGGYVENQSSTAITARYWAYSTTYIFDITDVVPANNFVFNPYANQQARNFCQSSHTRSTGRCGARYTF